MVSFYASFLAPSIEKIVSSGNKGLRISWKESNLPKDQKPKNHIIIYRTLKWRRRKETGSGASSYVLSGLEYDTTYNISVQTVTEAGESKPSQEMLKTTNSGKLMTWRWLSLKYLNTL